MLNFLYDPCAWIVIILMGFAVSIVCDKLRYSRKERRIREMIHIYRKVYPEEFMVLCSYLSRMGGLKREEIFREIFEAGNCFVFSGNTDVVLEGTVYSFNDVFEEECFLDRKEPFFRMFGLTFNDVLHRIQGKLIIWILRGKRNNSILYCPISNEDGSDNMVCGRFLNMNSFMALGSPDDNGTSDLKPLNRIFRVSACSLRKGNSLEKKESSC